MNKLVYALAFLGLVLFNPVHSECIHDTLDIKTEKVPLEDIDPESASFDGRMLASSYGDMRIIADYTHFRGSSSAKSYIQNKLMPAALNYFSKALQVPRLSTLKISSSSVCGLSVPSKYRSGVAGDLVLFITGESTSASWLAWAKPCSQISSTGRTYVGQVNFNLNGLVSSSQSEITDDRYATMHEITHVLGFSKNLFSDFAKSARVRSKSVNGRTVNYLDAEPLKSKLRSYFGCSSLAGAYLENQGGSGSAGSHFERRVFYNEFMTASAIKDSRITELSLAVLDSSGWYKVNYAMAEPFHWGKGKGCSFTDSSCSAARFDEFCSNSGGYGCYDTGRYGGYCGTSDSFADSCPYIRPYSNMDCENAGLERNRYISAEDYGIGSKCFMGTLYSGRALSKARPYCFKYSCTKQSDGDYTLKITVGSKSVSCTKAGSVSVSGYAGSLKCPDPNSYCATTGKKYCPRGCMGKGTCSSGKCNCVSGWSGTDCSIRSSANNIEGDEPEQYPDNDANNVDFPADDFFD